MEFSIPGFIKRFCTPNALVTLEEYLVDYASPETRAAGEKLIREEIAKLPPAGKRKRWLNASAECAKPASGISMSDTG